MDGCVHTAGLSKTGGGVLEDLGTTKTKRVYVFLWHYMQEKGMGEGCQENRTHGIKVMIKHAFIPKLNTMLSNFYMDT